MQPKSNIDGISKLPLGPVSGSAMAGSLPASPATPPEGAAESSQPKSYNKPKTSKASHNQTVTVTVLLTLIVTIALVGLAYYAYNKSK